MGAAMDLATGFRLADREVWPREGRIVGPSGPMRVEPKTMAVLLELARHDGGVVSREQIHAAVWPRQVVTDDVLTRCVGQLRRALGDKSGEPRFVETIARRGYRLLARVAPLPGRATGPPETLLVLPFQAYSGNLEPWLVDGLTELLITRLAAVRGLRVISRTTAMKFRDTSESVPAIAAQVGADWVVEGSVLGSANRLQVVAQLIDARTDSHAWAGQYLRDVTDLLLLQNTLAESIARAIERALGPAEAQGEWDMRLPAAAMRDYLRGRHLLSGRSAGNLREALGHFERVTRAAPDYAPAWASQAEIHMLLAHYGVEPSQTAVATTRALLERALTLDAHQPIGLACLGAVSFFFDRDFDAAQRYLHEALARLPSYSVAMLSLANVQAVRREFEEAEAWLAQALLVDPLDVGISMNVGDHRILSGRYRAAVEALEQAQRLSPGHRPSALRLAWAAALAGIPDLANDTLARLQPAGASPDAQWLEYEAVVAAALGDSARAAAAADALEQLARSRFVTSWGRARALAAAGRSAAAIAALSDCLRDRSSSVPFMAITPAFTALASEPDFRELVRRAGLP